MAKRGGDLMAKTLFWSITSAKNKQQSTDVGDATVIVSGNYPVLMRDTVQYARFYAEKVVIQDGVREIGSSAFFEFYSLADVVLPDTLEIIGDYAFCKSYVKELDLPDSVISIGRSFLAKTRVKELTLPARIIRTPNYFIEDSSVKTIKMSKTQLDQTILYALRHNSRTRDYRPFSNTDFLENIVIDGQSYNSKGLKKYLLGKYELFDEKGSSLKGHISRYWFEISSMFSNSYYFNDF